MAWPFVDLCTEECNEENGGCCCKYTGPNLPATGITPGDSLDIALQKIDAVLFNMLYPPTTTTTTTTIP